MLPKAERCLKHKDAWALSGETYGSRRIRGNRAFEQKESALLASAAAGGGESLCTEKRLLSSDVLPAPR